MVEMNKVGTSEWADVKLCCFVRVGFFQRGFGLMRLLLCMSLLFSTCCCIVETGCRFLRAECSRFGWSSLSSY